MATAVSPGAIYVIPGNTRFTIDLRSGDDGTRRSAVEDIESGIEAIGARRGATVQVKRPRESKSCPCAPWLMERTAAAIEAEGIPDRDAMAMESLENAGMLFVRCNGGISHNPLEGILAEDAETSARVLLRFIRDFEPQHGTA